MKNTVRMYCYFLFMFLISKCNGNPVLPMNTIQIPSNRMNNNFIRSERYYIKQQVPRVFPIQGPSQTFVKVSGLTMPFHHTEPLLYKIKYEGRCLSSYFNSTWLHLRFMIDDNLLYLDKFLPNTANRYQYNTGYSENDSLDYIGGLYWFVNTPTVTQCSFSDIIYLNPGLHVVDVGVRGGHARGAFPTYVVGGALTIELAEYDLHADVGMKPINAKPIDANLTPNSIG
ncbi:unnamed protein product [Adineta steineri]|uniref:Uncharacterized protein n=1 Tax=Adineta steineri TaxID=433720 RepID=A0A819LC13_9BILA|nr:unnamed protein product [Adineta steineri]CAF0862782.1 unnamed protein product [Adineta steineri]CAF3958775.1 unnamed protein product [Adineta steineri]CAF4103723.1 unnamed protein product [Adineta steineri]